MLELGKVDSLVDRFDAIKSQMATNPDPESYIRLSRDYAELEPVVGMIIELRQIEAGLVEVNEVLQDKSTEAEIYELAESEKSELTQKQEELTQKVRIALLPKDIADSHDAILEVRAGTGGDEAALFAGDLYRMYSRYSELKGWKFEKLSANEGEKGGFKEIIATVAGDGVFSHLKFESGVHRVQRVPETESNGRIHTSAATVAVLPLAEEVDVEVKSSELRVDTYRASGAGGQHLNKTDSAVRITHEPTGIVVAVQDERSQHKNKERALKLLRAKLFEIEREKKFNERAETRKLQVGSGDRSERIRTYNFPQGRITDHRIGLTLYKLEKIINGEGLDEVVDALILDHQTTLLSLEDVQ